jgi:tetratricopeptide (TPR) repeat protein
MFRTTAVMVCLLLTLTLPGVMFDSSAKPTNGVRPDEAIQARNKRIEEAITSWGGNTPVLREAHAELQRIVKTNPNDAWAHTQLARAEYRLGYTSGEDYDPEALRRAEALAARALTLDPRYLEAYLTAANIARYQGDVARARRLLAEARAVDPRSPFVSLALADTDRAEGKLDAALSQYRAVIAAHGDDTDALHDAYWSMAQIHGERREWALQEAAYLNVLRLEPDSAWAKINYAGALLSSGKYDQAIEHATAALKQMDFGVGRLVLAQAYFRKGWQLYKQRKPEEAAKNFEASTQAHPYYFGGYYGFGVYFEGKARAYYDKAKTTRNREEALDLLDRAERSYRQALSLEPDESVVRDGLGRVLADQKWLRR